MKIHDELPTHPVPESARSARARLTIDGLVAQACSLEPADLASLPRVSVNDDFRCEEGWSVPDQRWTGIPLREVLQIARPLAEARYVRVGAGDYVLPLKLEEIKAAVLCDALNDAPLALEHGAPWRLFVANASCFSSVKWVDRLELAAQPGENTAERIARGRLPGNG